MAFATGETGSTDVSTSLSAQLDNCSIGTPSGFPPSNPSQCSKNDDFTLKEGGMTYLRGDRMPATKGKKKGWFWNHGEEIYCVDNEQWFWLCSQCWNKKQFRSYKTTSTFHLKNHLRADHCVTEESSQVGESTNAPSLCAIDANDETLAGPLDDTTPVKWITRFTFKTLKQRLVQWIVAMHITFSQVENDWFRAFLAVFNTRLVALVPNSGDTIRAWIMEDFQQRRSDIGKQLRESKSLIHLSYDLWTSPNHLALIGVIGHYVSSDYKVETTLLGLRRLKGSHSGENIAEAIVSVVEAYQLVDRVGYFVLDNARSNDTCAAAVIDQLGITDTKGHRRLRCLGHILNLSAKAILFGENSEVFERDVATAALFGDEKAALRHWRSKGALGKLHNAVVYIRATPQRREDFLAMAGERVKELESVAESERCPDEDREIADPLIPIQDNDTRWNSWFSMIGRALDLRDAIDLFIRRRIQKNDGSLSKQDELTLSDWDVIARMKEILGPFHMLTKRTEGRAKMGSHGALWEVLPTMEYLLITLERKAVEYGVEMQSWKQLTAKTAAQIFKQMDITLPDHKHILQSIKHGWSKLDGYYGKLDESPAYAAAILLHPEHKSQFLKRHWKETPNWIARAEEAVKSLWLTRYKDTVKSSMNPMILPSTKRRDPSDFDQFLHPPDYLDDIQREAEDEFEQYMKVKTVIVKPGEAFDVCEWWRVHESEWPSLARMAFDMIAIPAMSSECERLFSSSKLLLSDRRARMKEDIIEASECLRYWYAANRIHEK